LAADSRGAGLTAGPRSDGVAEGPRGAASEGQVGTGPFPAKPPGLPGEALPTAGRTGATGALAPSPGRTGTAPWLSVPGGAWESPPFEAGTVTCRGLSVVLVTAGVYHRQGTPPDRLPALSRIFGARPETVQRESETARKDRHDGKSTASAETEPHESPVKTDRLAPPRQLNSTCTPSQRTASVVRSLQTAGRAGPPPNRSAGSSSATRRNLATDELFRPQADFSLCHGIADSLSQLPGTRRAVRAAGLRSLPPPADGGKRNDTRSSDLRRAWSRCARFFWLR
jgi:hypothetical protein